MSRIFILLCLIMTLAGCATTKPSVDSAALGDPGYGKNSLYYVQITDWQGRLNENQIDGLDFSYLELWRQRVGESGWSAELVRDIMTGSRELTRYEMEIEDHWDTPGEFVERNFQGDCEDIAIFMLATLKSLGYPHDVKVLAVQTPFEDHALLKVEMPDERFEVFETVRSGRGNVIKLVYTTIVEFDEKSIFFPQEI